MNTKHPCNIKGCRHKDEWCDYNRLDVDARTLREAADEIEQLHRTIEDLRAYAEQDSCRYANLCALINAWINALDELNAEWRDDDTYVISNRYNDAETALRKAVGR